MLPREMNGVVDPSLRVYGTTNIRVIDLSIIPLHIAAHTQGQHNLPECFQTSLLINLIAIVYAIAEQAADILKSEILSSQSEKI